MIRHISENVVDPFVSEIVAPVLFGNAKRKQSCKQIGGEKKKRGHLYEDYFKGQYFPESLSNKTEYGATSDASICSYTPFGQYLAIMLDMPMYPNVAFYHSSIKSGTCHQYVLGNIPELLVEDNLAVLNDKTSCAQLFNKYLKKSSSEKPCDLLTFYDVDSKKWVFFNMDNVVDFIVQNATWRKLPTGRLKGDFNDTSRKGFSQYITYEYRESHGSHFLGLNGGKGEKFIRLLQKNIAFVEDDLDLCEN
jgi:hypothetical protein